MAVNRDAARRRKRKKRGIIFKPLAYLLMIAAMAIGIGVFFKISHVEVAGNTMYTSDEIIAASGIRTGDSLFFINNFQATGHIIDSLPYVDEATFSRKLPGTIVIGITESYPLASLRLGDNYYIIDKKCKILEKTDYSGSIGTIAIWGVTPILPAVGDKIAAGQDKLIEIEYLTELMTLILERNMQSDISEIDVTNVSNITFRYMERFTIEMGKHERLEYKLELLESVMEETGPGETGVIDLKKDREAHVIPD